MIHKTHPSSNHHHNNSNNDYKSNGPCYLFGYGSLICSKSRSLTCPELSNRSAIPVVIQGLERRWNKQASMGMTAMGARFSSKASCAGVLVPLHSPNHELPLFDKREQGYKRVRVDPKKIGKIPYLKKQHQGDQHDEFFQRHLRAAKIQVWVYVPEKARAPTSCHPIAQNYVDTILRGCLATGGEDLCAEFLKKTTGWHPNSHIQDDDESNNNNNSDTSSDASSDNDAKDEDEHEEAVWINDRSNPVYRRGDASHSRQHAQTFDRLIRRYRPDYFSLRVNDSSRRNNNGKVAKCNQ